MHLHFSPPFNLGIMDLSGGGAGLRRSSSSLKGLTLRPCGVETCPGKTLYSQALKSKDQDTLVPGRSAWKGGNRIKVRPRDFQSWTPVSPSTSALSWTRSLRRHRGAQPPRSVCVCGATYRPGSGWRLSTDSRRISGRSSRCQTGRAWR